jgi:hypothetical protein
MNTVIEKSLLKELIEMAEDGYILHKRNGCHQEFLSEDRDNIKKAKEIYASQSEQGYSEAFWEEIRERFRDHAKEHLHFTDCDGRYKAGYGDAVDFSFEWFKSSLPQQGYSEAEVKELLRQQREKCARAYLDNFKNHGILNAPEPQLKSSVT